jgi:hypothetical protein
MNDELLALSTADRKAEEATRIDPQQPINLDDAPWWLKKALLRWKSSEGASEG